MGFTLQQEVYQDSRHALSEDVSPDIQLAVVRCNNVSPYARVTSSDPVTTDRRQTGTEIGWKHLFLCSIRQFSFLKCLGS